MERPYPNESCHTRSAVPGVQFIYACCCKFLSELRRAAENDALVDLRSEAGRHLPGQLFSRAVGTLVCLEVPPAAGHEIKNYRSCVRGTHHRVARNQPLGNERSVEYSQAIVELVGRFGPLTGSARAPSYLLSIPHSYDYNVRRTTSLFKDSAGVLWNTKQHLSSSGPD